MKFTYKDTEYDLAEIVGEKNLQKADGTSATILTKDGSRILRHHFPEIHVRFEEVFVCSLGGEQNSWILEAECIDSGFGEGASTVIGRSFGEVSMQNLQGIGKRFPMAVLENRARNRALFEYLGIIDVFSEEEMIDLDKVEEPAPYDEPRAQMTPPTCDTQVTVEQPSTNGSAPTSLTKQIKDFAATHGIDADKRIDYYRRVLGDKNLTPEQIQGRATPEIQTSVLDLMKEETPF